MEKPAFGRALRKLRKSRKMSQEDFTDVCTQAYLSQLERDMKSPTLGMIESLAAQMQISPLALLIATYAEKHPDIPISVQIETALAELAVSWNEDSP